MTVFRLQISMARLGVRPGGLDGQIGPLTRAALAELAIEYRQLRDLEWPAAVPVLLEILADQDTAIPALTLGELRSAFPRFAYREHYPDSWVEGLNAALVFIHADTLRAAHFLGQLAHESDGFATLEEYASGSAYEGRVDLGNTRPGDGVRYKGRGPIQLTGRANYRRISAVLGVPAEEHPEIIASPALGFLTAGLYWLDHGCNADADEDNITAVTVAINGGLNGVTNRGIYLAAAKQLLRSEGV